MLKLAYCVADLDVEALLGLYSESQQINDHLSYGRFYESLLDFFRNQGVYAIWVESGRYTSALRLEPHLDGWLLSGLETHPLHRCKGYGKSLIAASVQELHLNKVYSHIRNNNLPSIIVHSACGFVKISDVASLLDGTVSHSYATFLYQRCNKA